MARYPSRGSVLGYLYSWRLPEGVRQPAPVLAPLPSPLPWSSSQPLSCHRESPHTQTVEPPGPANGYELVVSAA